MHFIDLATADGPPLNHRIAKEDTCPGCLANNPFRVSDTHSCYCRQRKRRPDAVQYLRDFHSFSFKEACRQLGMELNIAPHATLPRQLASYNNTAADIFGNEWQEQALRFVMDCHYRLMATPAALGLLYDRGFTDGTMQQFYLGWHEALSGEQKRPWPPVGLVIPTFDLGFERLIKIRVQPVDDQELCVSVSGLIRSAGVYGDAAGKPVVVLERELDAMLVQQCAGDVCCPVALGGCLLPDEECDRLLREACGVLYAVGNKTAFRCWRERYPGIVEWEMPRVGDGFGDGFGVGVRLRRWVLDGIRCLG